MVASLLATATSIVMDTTTAKFRITAVMPDSDFVFFVPNSISL